MHSLHHTHRIAVLDHHWLCEEKTFVKDCFGANINSTLLNLFFLRSLRENKYGITTSRGTVYMIMITIMIAIDGDNICGDHDATCPKALF